MYASFIDQLRKVLADQRRELREIERKKSELTERQAELSRQKSEVASAIVKAEELLETLGAGE